MTHSLQINRKWQICCLKTFPKTLALKAVLLGSKQSKKGKQKPVNSASDNSEDYNLPFLLTEVKQANGQGLPDVVCGVTGSSL